MRRVNAQTIHIHHTYRTSSQASSLHNQPSRTFELLHATFQQRNSTSSSFPVTLWPWVNIRVIQTRIKLYTLVAFSIIPALKHIDLQVSWHMTKLNIYYIKSCQQSSLPWILLVQNKVSMSFSKATGCGNTMNFIQIDTYVCEKMGHCSFWFLIQL